MSPRVRFWPIADVRPGEPAAAMQMSASDPKRTSGSRIRLVAILQSTVGQLCKPGANACCGDQGKPGAEEPSREQRFSGSERRGADLYGDLVQQTGVVKLRCEAAAAHDPHIPTVGSREHLRVRRAYVAVSERYVGTFKKDG